MLPTVPGFAPVLTEKITKAQDNQNPSLEKQLVSPLSHIHCHSPPRKPTNNQEQIPYVVLFSRAILFSFFPFQCEYIFVRKNTVAVPVVQMSTPSWVVEGSYTVAELKITIQRPFLSPSHAEKVMLLQTETDVFTAPHWLHHKQQGLKSSQIPRFCKVSQDVNLNQKDGYQTLM